MMKASPPTTAARPLARMSVDGCKLGLPRSTRYPPWTRPMGSAARPTRVDCGASNDPPTVPRGTVEMSAIDDGGRRASFLGSLERDEQPPVLGSDRRRRALHRAPQG